MVCKTGIGLVPEGRQIFPNLTTHENLIATAREDISRFGVSTVFTIFSLNLRNVNIVWKICFRGGTADVGHWSCAYDQSEIDDFG